MIVPRVKYFANPDLNKDKSNLDNLKVLGNVAGGVGIATGGIALGDRASKRSSRYLKNSNLKAKDAESIYRKLEEAAKKKGTRVVEDPNFPNSMYLGTKDGKSFRNSLAKLIRKTRKTGDDKYIKEANRLKSEVIKEELRGSKVAFNNLGKDTVIMGKLKGADVLAHELGHSNYMRPGRSKSVIGKAAHKLSPVSTGIRSRVSNVGSAINGFHSGIMSAKLKAEGNKESTWNKVKTSIVPVALAAPMLIAEGKASLNGLKNMKKLGASKELMEESRKRLGAAWGTYAGKALINNIAAGEGSRLVGKGIGSIIYKDKKDDNTNN